MCIFVYLGADRPLDGLTGSGLQLSAVKRQNRMHRDLRDGVQHLYIAFGGCACALTRDGAEADELAQREALLDDLVSFLDAATTSGPVQALVTDGNTKTPPAQASISVAEIRDFDFDTA